MPSSAMAMDLQEAVTGPNGSVIFLDLAEALA